MKNKVYINLHQAFITRITGSDFFFRYISPLKC
jgi:hypothetical protein